MDSNERLDKLEEVVSEILIDTHKLNEKVQVIEQKVNSIEQKVHNIEQGVDGIEQKVNGLNHRLDGFQQGFNRFAELLLDKFDTFTSEMKRMREDQQETQEAILGMREEMKRYQDHEERIRRIEQTIFQKGA